MGRKRLTDDHQALRVYVKHGRYKDIYYTIIDKKHHGLGNDRALAERKAKDLQAGRISKKHDTGYVFAARSGAPSTDSGFNANWSKIMADFVADGGDRFTAHDLRAMYVTEMVSRNENPETHKNAATTRRVYDRRCKVKVTPTF